MSRSIGGARLLIAAAAITLGVAGTSSPAVLASPPQTSSPSIGTPLPAGWELCILLSVGAPGTPENVANLDEWQTVEGGSTNNDAAYNPFNSRQATDVNGAALPLAPGSGAFPAFQTWAAGCAASAAALLQPSMTPIVTALRMGTLSPPGAFLAAVDETRWCAPTDGVPCYANQVLAGEVVRLILAGHSTQTSALLTTNSSFDADLQSYEQASVVAAADNGALATRNGQLQAAELQVSAANLTLSSATRTLRQMAVDNYTTDSALRFNQDFTVVDTPDEQDTIGQFLLGLASSTAIGQYDRAKSVAATAASQRQTAAAAAAQAAANASAASSSKEQALTALQQDVKAYETGLSCAPPPVSTAPASQVAGPTTGGQLWAELQACLVPNLPPPTPSALGSR